MHIAINFDNARYTVSVSAPYRCHPVSISAHPIWGSVRHKYRYAPLTGKGPELVWYSTASYQTGTIRFGTVWRTLFDIDFNQPECSPSD